MPKETIIIKDFKGMAPSIGGASNPIYVENMRVDLPDNIASPENTDTVIQQVQINEPMDSTIMSTKMYVDDTDKVLDITAMGRVKVDGVEVSNVSVGSVLPSVDVIGRQAVIATGRLGAPKFIRVGFPGVEHLNFGSDEIIVEDDYISSKYLNLGNIRDALYLNEDNILALYNGSTSFTMMDLSAPASYKSADLAEDEILAICGDIDTYGASAPYYACTNYVYYAYMDSGTLKINRFDLAGCYDAAHSNIAADLNDALFAHEDRVGTGIITVNTDTVPSGYRVNSIAITAGKCFVAFTKHELDTVAKLGSINVVAEDEDLLFAFDKTLFDSASSTVSVDAETLIPSMLPWMPYVETPGISVLRAYYPPDSTTPGIPRVSKTKESFYLPYGVDVGDFHLAGAISEITLPTTFVNGRETTKGYIPIPGNCGVARSDLKPFGSLCVMSYTDNVVGYLVGYDNDGIFPSTVAHANEGFDAITLRTHNGLGYFKLRTKEYASTFGSQTLYSVSCFAASVSAPSSDGNNLGDGHRVAFYCWNGEPMVDYDGYNYNLNVGTNSIDVIKHFDDVNTGYGTRGASHHARFLLVPIAILDTSTDKAFSSLGIGVAATSETVFSIISFADNPVGIVTMYTPAGDLIAMTTGSVVEQIGQIYVGGYSQAALNTDPIAVPSNLSRILPNVNGATKEIMLVSDDAVNISTIVVTEGDSVVANGDVTIGVTTEHLLDNAILSVPETPTGDTTGIAAGTTMRYKVSFIYDGSSISPLPNEYIDAFNAANYTVAAKISFSLEQLQYISKRITSINVYAAAVNTVSGEEEELYRLVKSVPITDEYFSVVSDYYEYSFTDSGSRLASFNADSGYSESARNVSVNRDCQCVCSNYLFAGNIKVPEMETKNVHTNNTVVRSLPFQPSVFNYAEDFVILKFTPIALVPFSGRVYAFGAEQYSIINPDTLAVEHTSNSCGLANKSHVVVNDYGIFAYYDGSVFNIDGAKCVAISDPVKVSTNYAVAPALDGLESAHIFLGYVQSRDMIIVAGNQAGVLYVFGYGIKTGKWCVYDVSAETTNGGDQYPIGIYDSGSTCVISVEVPESDTYTQTSYELFSGSTKRTMLLEWILDCGDPEQKKTIYDIDVRNGATAITATKKIDGATFISKLHKQTFRLSVGASLPITSIRMIVRRYVVTETVTLS